MLDSTLLQLPAVFPEAFWHLQLLAEQSQGHSCPRPPQTQNLLPSCANNRFIWAFSPSWFRKNKKIAFQCHRLCCASVPVKIERARVDFQLFKAKKEIKAIKGRVRGKETSDQRIGAARCEPRKRVKRKYFYFSTCFFFLFLPFFLMEFSTMNCQG